MAIKSWRHKGLKKFHEDADPSGIPPVLAAKLERMLDALDAAVDASEMGLFPGWRLHLLKGDRKGFWSITVSGNWRIVWRMQGPDAFEVELVDYH